MALGTFTLVIDADFLDGRDDTTAKVTLTLQGTTFLVDDNQFRFLNELANGAAVSLPYSAVLPTNVAAGGAPSTSIGYKVTVTNRYGSTTTTSFAARAAGSTTHLSAITASESVNVAANLNDTTVAGLVNDTASVTRAAIDTAFVSEAELDADTAALVNNDTSATRVALTSNGKKPVGRDELVVNVKDYGAVGDGVVDDTTAIQNAANAASGKILYVAPGHYKLTAPINLPAAIKIEGINAKAGSASRFTTTHTGYAFVTPAASNFRLEVRNIHVTCISGFDARETSATTIGLASFDSVAFGGGDGTGVAINCLNHDFSKITNCGFFWSGMCAVRLSGWYGTGQKAITAMEVSNNYFGGNVKIGVSADVFESIYCQQNDFGSTDYPVDIGGERFGALTDGTSTIYYKRGEAKPAEIYFGYGTNFYFNENHIEGAERSISAWGKNHDLKMLHINNNNNFVTVAGNIFARLDRVQMSTVCENKIDYSTHTASTCFNYKDCTNVTFRDNHHFTRTFDGAANPNTYFDAGGNFFTDIRKGATGTAYNLTFTPSFSRVLLEGPASGLLPAKGSLVAIGTRSYQPVSVSASLALDATVTLFTYTGYLAGTLNIACLANGVGSSASVWTVSAGGATRLSNEAGTTGLYAITVDTAAKQIKLQAKAAGTVVYDASGFLTGIV